MKKLLLIFGLIISMFLGNNISNAQSLTLPGGTFNVLPPVLLGESSPDGADKFTVMASGYTTSATIYVDSQDSHFTLSLTGGAGTYLSSLSFSVNGSVNQDIYVKYTPTAIGSSGVQTLAVYCFAPYSWQTQNVQGFGMGPEMLMEGRETGSDPWDEIDNGETTPSVSEGTDFGDALASSGTVDRIFQISNTIIGGLSGNLVLDEYAAGKYVEITGADADQFSVTAEPTSPVGPSGGTTTYTVRFTPTSAGVKTAQVSIGNNDSDENPYNFAIQGTGTLVAPDAPTATAATSINHNSFYANWTVGGGGVTEGYYLDVATDNSFTSFVSGYNNLDVGLVTTYQVSGLDANTDYYYRLKAYNTGGTNGYSNTVSLISATAVPIASSPTNIGTNNFYANWGFITGATSYRLDVNTQPNFAVGTAILDDETVTTTYKNITGLAGGTTYYYRVRSFNGNASGNSNIISSITFCNAPVATAATDVVSNSFTANWTAASGGTPDSYMLDVSTSNAFLSFVSGYENLTVYGTSISVTGLTQNTIYYYRVRSANVSGASNNSNTIMVQLPGSTNWVGSVNSSWNIAGNWDNGIPGPNTEVTILPGVNQPYLNTIQECNSLTMMVDSELDITSGVTLTVNGDFMMESTALGSGSLIEYGGLDVQGTSTVERFITKDRWYYLAVPMSDQLSGVFEGAYMKYWDEPTQIWVYITSLTHPLSPGAGFATWNDDTEKTFTYTGGEVNQGDYTPAISYTPSGDAWNVVGNPYPSGIDWDDASWTKTNIDGTVYVYAGSLGNFRTWNSTTGGSLVDGVIPAGQAFSVKANGSNPAIEISDGARVHGVDAFKSEFENVIEMYANGNGYGDVAQVGFYEEATPSFDSDFDAYKRWGVDEAPQLYTLAGDVNLTMNVLPLLSQNITIPVAYKVGIAGEYTIDVTNLESFVEPVAVYLEDKLSGEMINVEEQSSYTFAASPDDDEIRFELHFVTVVGIDDQVENSDVHIYSSGNSVFVRNSSDVNNGTISVYDITGTEILSTYLENIPLNEIDLNVKSGYYVVKVTTNNEVHSQKVFIK